MIQTSNSDQSTNIAHWRSILTLVVFFLTSKVSAALLQGHRLRAVCMIDIIVIFPFRVPLPRFVVSAFRNVLVKCRIILPRTSEPLRRRYVTVNFLSAPIMAILLLLATQVIDSGVLRRGILGSDGVRPINIMALFVSLVAWAAKGRVTSPALWLLTKRVGLSLHFARCDRSPSFPRILGCEERRRVRTEATLLPLSVLLDMCRGCRKRESQNPIRVLSTSRTCAIRTPSCCLGPRSWPT